MQVGISLPQRGPLVIDEGGASRPLQRLATDAEQAGYSSLWVSDRLLEPVAPRLLEPEEEPREVVTGAGGAFDPIAVLAVAATATDHIRLGTSVLVGPWYPPVLLARSLATLDQLSGGRLSIGLGLGRSIDEHEAVGVSPAARKLRIEELLDVLDAVWGEGKVEFDGPTTHLTPAIVEPKPVQQPRPPLLLAGFTPTGLDRVARRADGWNPAGLPVAALAPMWRAVRELAAGYGRDPDAMSMVVRAAIEVTAGPIEGPRRSYRGSVEQVAADLDATAEAGATEVILGVSETCTSVDELLATCDQLRSIADLC
jgi:probable F420-dependent oxidoreductase